MIIDQELQFSRQELDKYAIGQEINLGIVRNDQHLQVKIILEEVD